MIDLVSIFLEGEQGYILNELELKVGAGEVVGLIGPSGSGKSAALRLASGAQRPQRGRLRLEGKDVTNHLERLRKNTALSTAELCGPYDLSVSGWMSYWSSVRGLKGRVHEREAEALEVFGLTDVRDHPISWLSHGQRRLLDLARVWAINPSVYLLDNPDMCLDGKGFRKLTRAIRKVHEQGKTVILATTYPNLPMKVCRRVASMKGGCVMEVKRREEDQFTAFITKAQGWA